jgi:hypothetical protein
MLIRLIFPLILGVLSTPAMSMASWPHAACVVSTPSPAIDIRAQTSPVVRIAGTVEQVFPAGRHHHGADHQHFTVRIERILAIRNGDAGAIAPRVFVALRFGDREGLDQPIRNLRPGMPIELQGEYIDAADAYATRDNEGPARLPVLHFTHHPVGYVLFEGIRYN